MFAFQLSNGESCSSLEPNSYFWLIKMTADAELKPLATRRHVYHVTLAKLATVAFAFAFAAV